MRDQYSRQYIDEHGNVTGFNYERYDNMNMGFKRFENPSNGLGIFNFLKTHVTANDKNWKLVLAVFNFIVACSKCLKKDNFRSRLYKKMMMLTPDKEKNSSGIVMPLNVDLSEAAEKVPVPMDLIKGAIEDAGYIAAMNSCICRDARDCKDYPHDIACLFIGKIGEQVVKHGIARRVDPEEACAIVDRAAEYGLVGHSLWAEVEQLIWGIRNDDLDKFLEICFCCPCCCVSMNLARNAPRDLRNRFHPVGWTAVPDRTKCTGCGECLSVNCP